MRPKNGWGTKLRKRGLQEPSRRTEPAETEPDNQGRKHGSGKVKTAKAQAGGLPAKGVFPRKASGQAGSQKREASAVK